MFGAEIGRDSVNIGPRGSGAGRSKRSEGILALSGVLKTDHDASDRLGDHISILIHLSPIGLGKARHAT